MLKKSRNPILTQQRLIEATVKLVLAQGFSATTIDQICAEAALTKGSFFHHFKNKEAIGLAVIEWWSQMGTDLYAVAWADVDADPLDQLYAMIAIMEGFASNPDQSCVCAIGMIAQELAGSHPEMRDRCGAELGVWTQNVTRLLTAAKERHSPRQQFEPEEVAWFLNSLWQGSMLVAKTQQNQSLILHNLRQARTYINSLFFNPNPNSTLD